MAVGILGRKVGMTTLFREGLQVPVTVVEAGPCSVVQEKTEDGTDGYTALQLGFVDKKEKRVTSPMSGHFKRAGVGPKRFLREFRDMTGYKTGDTIGVADIFEVGDTLDVTGKSKGRGFSGVMKRHGFHGHKATHGTHESKRGPGSIGTSAWPARVWKGKKMAGQFGNTRVTVRNLEVIEIIPERNLIMISGALPGARNTVLELRKKD